MKDPDLEYAILLEIALYHIDECIETLGNTWSYLPSGKEDMEYIITDLKRVRDVNIEEGKKLYARYMVDES
jgi:hypothetical protein